MVLGRKMIPIKHWLRNHSEGAKLALQIASWQSNVEDGYTWPRRMEPVGIVYYPVICINILPVHVLSCAAEPDLPFL